MDRNVVPLARPARWAIIVLSCFVLITIAKAAAGWHKYDVLLSLPSQPSDQSDGAIVSASMWFGNVTGWWRAAFGVALLLFILWLTGMRALADTLWPEGQRRHHAWVLFGWVVPVGQLFIPKMFINDVWAAAQPIPRRRGNPLLTVWWLSVLAACHWGTGGDSPLKEAVTVGAARPALQQVLLNDGLFVTAALLTIAIVRKLSAMMSHAALEHQGGRAGIEQ